MKKILIAYVLLLTIIGLPAFAQTDGGSPSYYSSQSLNGSTGLYSLPSGRIGWDATNFGLDVGYRAIINNNDGVTHIPAITASFLKWFELSAALDIQPNHKINDNDDLKQYNDDLLFGVKVRIINNRNTSLALGGNIQLLNFNNDHGDDYNAYQPYIAITYAGSFFTMPADTTLVFGKTFYSGGPKNNSNIDFGMGFDLILFPEVLGNAVHWIIDFANFAYSDNAWPNDGGHHTRAWYRGIMNTGFRIDLSTIPPLSKFKLTLDFVFNDLFDHRQRSFTVGTVFGFSVN